MIHQVLAQRLARRRLPLMLNYSTIIFWLGGYPPPANRRGTPSELQPFLAGFQETPTPSCILPVWPGKS